MTARPRTLTRCCAVLASLFVHAMSLAAQTDGTCVPVSERAGRAFGCFITARTELGALAAAVGG